MTKVKQTKEKAKGNIRKVCIVVSALLLLIGLYLIVFPKYLTPPSGFRLGWVHFFLILGFMLMLLNVGISIYAKRHKKTSTENKNVRIITQVQLNLVVIIIVLGGFLLSLSLSGVLGVSIILSESGAVGVSFDLSPTITITAITIILSGLCLFLSVLKDSIRNRMSGR